jgi:signal transduction histidine kinase
MVSGNIFLTHAVKNELAKISMCTENIRDPVNRSEQQISDNTGVILETVSQLLNLANKVKENLDIFVLEERPASLAGLTERVLKILEPCLESKGIKVNKHFTYSRKIICDEIHVQEVLLNIIRKP